MHALDEHDQPHLIPISQLKIGDKVLAKSEWKAEAESLSYEPITDVLITPNSPRTLVHLTLADGQTLTATDGHPLRTTEGWRDAILLKKGGKLLLKDSGDAEAELGAGLAADSAAEKAGIKGAAANTATPRTLEIIDVRHSRETLTTYNLEVANAHTFFVGEDGVLVHNARGARGKQREGVWNDCGGRCVYCKCTLEKFAGSPNSFECDHYIPVAEGEDKGVANQVGSCRTCNRRFGTKLPGKGLKPRLPGR